jgi:hypothetical protein
MTRFQRLILALFLSFSCSWLLSHPTTLALTLHPVTRQTNGCNVALESLEKSRNRVAIFASSEEKSSSNIGETELLDAVVSRAELTTPPTPTSLSPTAVEEPSSYPIDLPSPILLAASMLLAIVGTGVRQMKEWNDS